MSCRSALAFFIAVLMPLTAVADPLTERQARQENAAAARALLDQQRAALRAEFERNKAERLRLPVVPDHLERARRASDQVLNDMSLQRGDVVSTVDGLFVFVGDGERSRSPTDFLPLRPTRPPQ